MVSWIWTLSDVPEEICRIQQPKKKSAAQNVQVAEYIDDVALIDDDWPDV